MKRNILVTVILSAIALMVAVAARNHLVKSHNEAVLYGVTDLGMPARAARAANPGFKSYFEAITWDWRIVGTSFPDDYVCLYVFSERRGTVAALESWDWQKWDSKDKKWVWGQNLPDENRNAGALECGLAGWPFDTNIRIDRGSLHDITWTLPITHVTVRDYMIFEYRDELPEKLKPERYPDEKFVITLLSDNCDYFFDLWTSELLLAEHKKDLNAIKRKYEVSESFAETPTNLETDISAYYELDSESLFICLLYPSFGKYYFTVVDAKRATAYHYLISRVYRNTPLYVFASDSAHFFVTDGPNMKPRVIALSREMPYSITKLKDHTE